MSERLPREVWLRVRPDPDVVRVLTSKQSLVIAEARAIDSLTGMSETIGAHHERARGLWHYVWSDLLLACAGFLFGHGMADFGWLGPVAAATAIVAWIQSRYHWRTFHAVHCIEAAMRTLYWKDHPIRVVCLDIERIRRTDGNEE